ncbi:MAG: Flp family type IVb pilin [Vampirovibrionia bacterium]
MERNKGQNLIEFLLIVALVAIGGIFALTMLGGNAYNLFANSAEKQKNFDPFDVKNSAANEIASNNGGSSTVTVVSSEVIDGYNVDRNSDGSMTINYGSQTVNLSAEVLSLNDAVFETSGASGDTLVATIGYLIDKYSEEYPDDVPLELFYGTGIRSWNEGYAVYSGDAAANSITVKVGNNIVMFQNDQDNEGASGVAGVFRLEGQVMPGNEFVGTLSGSINTGYWGNGDFVADYRGTLSNTSGVMDLDGDLNNCSVDGVSQTWTYDWNFNFPYNFNLS